MHVMVYEARLAPYWLRMRRGNSSIPGTAADPLFLFLGITADATSGILLP